MSNELVPKSDMTISSLGEIFARSGYFSDARDAAQAVVKILAGKELGLPPIASMTGINIIKGKVSLSATVMAAVLRRHGDYNYRVKKHTEEVCEIEFFFKGESIGISKFDKQDAAKAGLLNGDNYKKYPRNMMFARAMSNGIRWYCPEILGGPAYTPGELEAGADSEGEDNNNVIDVQANEITEFAELLEKDEEINLRIKELFAEGMSIVQVTAVINNEFGTKFDFAEINRRKE